MATGKGLLQNQVFSWALRQGRCRKEACTDSGGVPQLFTAGRLYNRDRGLLRCDSMSTTALSLAQAARQAVPRLIKALLGGRRCRASTSHGPLQAAFGECAPGRLMHLHWVLTLGLLGPELTEWP